jgi:hypothetical protein
VPRAGVVNARRPGCRPGRSEAKSIDDAEHGTSIKDAMVPGAKTGFVKCDVLPGKMATRADPICERITDCFVPANSNMIMCTQAVRSSGTWWSTHDSDRDTTNAGVNDPVAALWGHGQCRTPGSFTPALVLRL